MWFCNFYAYFFSSSFLSFFFLPFFLFYYLSSSAAIRRDPMTLSAGNQKDELKKENKEDYKFLKISKNECSGKRCKLCTAGGVADCVPREGASGEWIRLKLKNVYVLE